MGVDLAVMHVFKTSGFYEKLDPDLRIQNQGDALKVLFKRLDHIYCKNTCPYELFHECPTVK
jgi:SulP family sulfate permease